MKLNYRPSSVAHIDFETQSRYDLGKGTSRKYAADPSTSVLTCVVKVDGLVVRMGPYLTAEDKETLALVASQRTLIAHNASFDANVWEHTLGLPEAEWFDTMPCCRAAGLPGNLDGAGEALGLGGKDPNGKRLIDMLCILGPKQPAPAVGPAHKLLLDYNQRDVDLLEQLYHRVKDFAEPEVLQMDVAVNRRGVGIDRPFATAMSSLFAEVKKRKGDEFEELTDGNINPRSQPQVVKWLQASGFNVSKSHKAQISALIANPAQFCTVGDGTAADEALEAIRDALEARREVTGIGSSKVTNALATLDDDDRLRDMFVYYGAHTGRWSGRRLQLQNMPGKLAGIDVRRIEPVYEAIAKLVVEKSELLGRRVPIASVLNAMLRRMVSADNFLVADYSAVEARCVAWMADEEAMLAKYRDPRGGSRVYLDMADLIYQRPISKKDDFFEYAVGKAVILGCGYGMSGYKFERTIQQRNPATLAALYKANIDIHGLVKLYRTTYAKIPALWKSIGEATKQVVMHGGEAVAGKCTFTRIGRDLHIVLPSGRPIVYRNARMEMVVPGYCKMLGMPERPIPTVVYQDPKYAKHPEWAKSIFGSMLTENISQGICRDAMASALVDCESEGLHTTMHIHDEIAGEDPPEKLDTLLRIMSTPPVWAPDFPILVEGYSGPAWTKEHEGAEYTEKLGFNGKVL